MIEIKGIQEAEVRRMAREHTKYWFFRPRAVRIKMLAIKMLAKGFVNMTPGYRHRVINALSRDASS